MTGAAFGAFSGSISSEASFVNVSFGGTFAVYPDVNTFNDSCSYALVVGTGSVPSGISADVTLSVMDDGLVKNELSVTLDESTKEITITKKEAAE